MEQTYWQKQIDTPLFPELIWSRPENKSHAGKLVVIGGTGQGFSATAEAYTAALKAGAGAVRVVLPASLQKTVSKLFPEAEFAPGTPSGSFAQTALAEFVAASGWADGVLLPGDIGKNSETSVLFESFLETFDGQVTITQDTADYFCQNPSTLLQRPQTLLVINLEQLRKLGSSVKFARAFTSEMGIVNLTEMLHEFTKRFTPYIIVSHQEQYIAAVSGNIITTPVAKALPAWRSVTASRAAVWWLQNPQKPLEALSTSLIAK